ncbi:MAG: hypothetical protein FDX02_08810 [Chlorobium sp.]|nr:MAG: hypothetical protein FDX02_08810 [Chlorobium sp.]
MNIVNMVLEFSLHQGIKILPLGGRALQAAAVAGWDEGGGLGGVAELCWLRARDAWVAGLVMLPGVCCASDSGHQHQRSLAFHEQV